jgi:hypothetical protein
MINQKKKYTSQKNLKQQTKNHQSHKLSVVNLLVLLHSYYILKIYFEINKIKL